MHEKEFKLKLRKMMQSPNFFLIAKIDNKLLLLIGTISNLIAHRYWRKKICQERQDIQAGTEIFKIRAIPLKFTTLAAYMNASLHTGIYSAK